MNYVICDDNRSFGESLKNRILHLEPESTVDVFRSGVELTAFLDENGDRTDCVFMDIELENGRGERVSGIELIAGIVRMHGNIKVVYVTGYPQSYFQSVFECPAEADPIAFLAKPVEDKYLKNALDKLRKHYVRYPAPVKNTASLPVKQSGDMMFVPLSDIIYISSSGHQIIIHTADKNIRYYDKLSHIEEKLGTGFTKCHKSFIINCEHIKQINGWTEVLLSDGSVCPISRSCKESFREAVIASASDPNDNAAQIGQEQRS